MQIPRVILIGGFVGAGKTTLIIEAAKRLLKTGRRVGIVSNDQAANLVDTALLQSQALQVREVAGGCFCCRFDELTSRLADLRQQAGAEVLLAEPVGSCTDLSATVLQPLKRFHADRYQLAPYSVLLDPHRLRQMLAISPSPGPKGAVGTPDFGELSRAGEGRREGDAFSPSPGTPGEGRGGGSLPANVQYIYRLQIEEADAIVLNKSDLLSAAELHQLSAAVAAQFPHARLFALSALRGDGIDAWLEYIMADSKSGQRIVDVDYRKYADGEAALGWLNASLRLDGPGHTDWPLVCQRMLDGIAARLRQSGAEIVHAKLLLTAPGGVLAGNLTASDQPASVRGQLRGDTPLATLVLNVRAHLDPQSLRQCVEGSIAAAARPPVHVETTELQCFSPAPPRPTHRFAAPA